MNPINSHNAHVGDQLHSRNAHVGDQLYLQTMFPITVDNQITIPPGTHVRGSIAELKRPGRIRGKSEAGLSRNPLEDIPEPTPAPIILRRYPYLGIPPRVVN